MTAGREGLLGDGAPSPGLEADRADPAARAGGVGVGRRHGTARALLAASRPRQWVKNLLVLAAPAAAGVLGHPVALGRTLGTLGLFVAASGGTYLLNDAVDVEADRRHPTKRLRPIAAGTLARSTAVAVALALLLGALVAAPLLAGRSLGLVVGGYVALTVAYSLWLKQVPFVELACLSLAFVLRALGGAAATGVPVSPWFLVVTSSGALLLAAGKRGAEQMLLGTGSGAHRRSLSAYPPWFLRALRLAAGAVAVAGYVLWALWRGANGDHRRDGVDPIVFVVSALPFAMAVAVLERLLGRGDGGAPEELALRNRTLQALGVACVALVAIGIYG